MAGPIHWALVLLFAAAPAAAHMGRTKYLRVEATEGGAGAWAHRALAHGGLSAGRRRGTLARRGASPGRRPVGRTPAGRRRGYARARPPPSEAGPTTRGGDESRWAGTNAATARWQPRSPRPSRTSRLIPRRARC